MRIATKSLLVLLVVVGTSWSINTQAIDDQCASLQGCTECVFDGQGNVSCIFVHHDAWCECTTGVAGLAKTCGTNGICTFDTWWLGPSGGGYSPGNGSSCTILIGEWCPPSCASCTTVFWF